MTTAEGRKVALVRGAAQNLGAELLRGLHQGGYASVLTESAQGRARAVRLARRWSRQGFALTVAPAAGSSARDAEGALSFAVQTMGRLDACVVCPALPQEGPLPHVGGELWQDTLDQLTMVFNYCQAAVGWFLQADRAGQLVCVTNHRRDTRRECGQTQQAVAAGAITALVHGMGHELRHTGVRINALALGATPPQPNSPTQGQPGAYEPENVAPLIEFFTSTEARDITGQTLAVYGQRLCLHRSLETAGVLRRDGPWTAEAVGHHWSRLTR